MTKEKFQDESDRLFQRLAEVYMVFLYAPDDGPDVAALEDVSFRLKNLAKDMDSVCNVYRTESGVICE